MDELAKRIVDIALSAIGLLAVGPVLISVIVAVWLQDFHSPFYIANRVGLGGRVFKMVKLRSMIVGAEKTGVDSTAGDDRRITRVGSLIRRYKLDELSQLWNVLLGDMSLVGPRPQVERDVAIYTDEERRLLSVKPGITDLSSIVFSDEGEILREKPDPDLAYNQLIRPWKSRLGLLYVDRRSWGLDIRLVCLTLLSLFSRRWVLDRVQRILEGLQADEMLRTVARRREPPPPYPPPGARSVIQNR